MFVAPQICGAFFAPAFGKLLFMRFCTLFLPPGGEILEFKPSCVTKDCFCKAKCDFVNAAAFNLIDSAASKAYNDTMG